MSYMEISSKTGHNVQEAVYKMAYEMNENSKKAMVSLQGSNSVLKSQESNEDLGMMSDRIRVKLKSDEKQNPYANANNTPMGELDRKKKGCCAN